MKPTALIFAPDADSPDFKPALTLGQGLPNEIEGQPVARFWKEVLRPRRFVDAKGEAHEVKPERIGAMLSNFKRLVAKGHKPTLPSHHPQAGEPKDALANLGHVIDARVNDRGGLETLCEFVGIDAIRASARNAASIGTILNFTDADGERYDEILDHVAIVPDPRLTDLNGFQPALAASSGPAVQAVVLTAAVERSEPPMNLTELRKALSLADNTADDAVIVKAVERLSADAATLATEKQRADAEKARADAAETAKLELSNSIPRPADPEILKDRMGVFSDKLDTLIERNHCTPQMKEAAMAIVAPGGAPSPLMLSQSVTTGPAANILKLLELSAANPFVQKTGAQPVGRTVPGAGNQSDPAAEGLALGQSYQKQALAARGLNVA